MREASRERAAGPAPIPSPRGGRRSQTWTSGPEEQLMMVCMIYDLFAQRSFRMFLAYVI